MIAPRLYFVSAVALIAAACGEPDHSPYAGGEVEAEAPADDGVEAEAAHAAPADAEDEEISALDQAARAVCEQGDVGFAALLDEGQGFTSRGADARVHIGWNQGGESYERIVYTPDLDDEVRLSFDGAVADFMRRNLVRGFDRTELTGVFRARDGRFCIVQTEPDIVAALREAARAVEPGLREAD